MKCNDEVDDYKSTGSVLEKLSLFEKLEQRQVSAVGALNTLSKQNSTTSSGSGNESPSGIRRNEDVSKSMRSIEKDPGMLNVCVYACVVQPLFE